MHYHLITDSVGDHKFVRAAACPDMAWLTLIISHPYELFMLPIVDHAFMNAIVSSVCQHTEWIFTAIAIGQRASSMCPKWASRALASQ